MDTQSIARPDIIVTGRFYLREFSRMDAEDMYRLNQDEEVIRYTGDTAFESVDAARNLIDKYEQYRLYGYGRWSVFHRETGEYSGWCGLKYHPENGETDLGYRFFKKFWGRGYATETATACLAYGFSQFSLPRIIARAMKDNVASIRVMEKIGMQYLSDYECGGQPGVIYSISNNG